MSDEGKRVLIIEDEDALGQVLGDDLRQAGFSVSRGRDGEEGLALALKERPDLILLDIVMPKMDGFGVMKNLRQNEWGKTAKIFLLTNLGIDEKMKTAIQEYKPAFYVVKTEMQLGDIVKKAKEILNEK